jgi:hypothetical protein
MRLSDRKGKALKFLGSVMLNVMLLQVIGQTATAQPLTWTFENVTFVGYFEVASSSSLTGSFTRDASTNPSGLLSWNIRLVSEQCNGS